MTYQPLSYAQGKTLRDIARTGRIVPTQARSLEVLSRLGLVEFQGGRLVLTAEGVKRNF